MVPCAWTLGGMYSLSKLLFFDGEHVNHRWMFDCCRIPGQDVDWNVSHAKEGDRGNSGHVVVLRRGRVWRLDPWHNSQLLGLEELQK